MRNTFLRFTLLGLASASLLSACADDATPSNEIETVSNGTRIIRPSSGALTAPSSAARDEIVREYLRGRGVAADSLQTISEGTHAGITTVRLEQTIGGLRVYGAYVKAALDQDGQLVHLIEKVATPTTTIAKPAINERAALAAALDDLDYGIAAPVKVGGQGAKSRFFRGTVFHREPTVEAVVYVDDNDVLQSGYLVETWSVVGNQLDHTLVDGSGSIFSSERRTANDSYNVFTKDPVATPQAVQPGGTDWLFTGSHRTIDIAGNNVRAYTDTDANNTPDTGGSPVSDGNFLTAADLTQAPSTTANRAVAVQNLFYLNNVLHDTLLAKGFTEAEGNFQENNETTSGLDSDSVNAEAQDGSGTDNANFATPTDGSNPRMQMYLWSGSAPSARVTVGGTDYDAFESAFGPRLTLAGASGNLAVFRDTKGDPLDGCSAGSGVSGKIALVARGTCDFTVKVSNAQRAGAIAVIITNNVDGAAFSPGGSGRANVSSAMVTLADGNTLREIAATTPGASAKLAKSPDPILQIDGDLDSDIVYHEYGHGLTWRMVGSMSGSMSGAIGEGASDVLAFLINGDDRIGEYSYDGGIRRCAYSACDYSYADMLGAEVHDGGEIYASIMWDLKERYQAAGLTADELLGDFVGGLSKTIAGPAVEDMRDGMLAHVALTTPGRACLIWEAFAAHGAGDGAKANRNRRGAVSSITESTAIPTGVCP